ncbi:FecCD family ABC transporter permease [Paenibacillus polymyxa]|uniref:FecCD family ABC transporter permease n=1 Tax=Paenibacillus polymyxa TaxID=1406 RepID=UPI003B594DE5
MKLSESSDSPAQSNHNQPPTQFHSRPWAASFILTAGLALLAFGIALSLSFGAASIRLEEVWNAVFHFNPELQNHQIIWEIRLPRILGGVLIGVCFAVAGAIMQGMTRNPLADSGLLGLNSGASLTMAICFALFPGTSFLQLMLYSFVGAALAVVMVYGTSAISKSGITPVRLVLAGAAVTALLSALGDTISLYFNVGQDLAFWYAGGLSGTKWVQLGIVVPWVVAAFIGALMLSRSITLLSLGDEIALSLGQRTGMVKVAGMILVLILAGAAVSLVGSIGFVGLIIPHITRKLVGVDYRWIIPCSAIMGALLIVFADLAARMINAPEETPVGVLIALIGVPFFLYLARKERRAL